MLPRAAALITYTKYLRRASSRSQSANSSRPLRIAVPLRPASVIKLLHRLDSLGGSAPGGRAGGRRRRPRSVPVTVDCEASRDRAATTTRHLTPTTQPCFLINGYSACFGVTKRVYCELNYYLECFASYVRVVVFGYWTSGCASMPQSRV